MSIMHSITNIASLARCTILDNVTFMMWKYQIRSTTMNIKFEGQIMHTHHAELCMLSWYSKTPWAVLTWLTRLYILSQREVSGISLPWINGNTSRALLFSSWCQSWEAGTRCRRYHISMDHSLDSLAICHGAPPLLRTRILEKEAFNHQYGEGSSFNIWSEWKWRRNGFLHWTSLFLASPSREATSYPVRSRSPSCLPWFGNLHLTQHTTLQYLPKTLMLSSLKYTPIQTASLDMVTHSKKKEKNTRDGR